MISASDGFSSYRRKLHLDNKSENLYLKKKVMITVTANCFIFSQKEAKNRNSTSSLFSFLRAIIFLDIWPHPDKLLNLKSDSTRATFLPICVSDSWFNLTFFTFHSDFLRTKPCYFIVVFFCCNLDLISRLRRSLVIWKIRHINILHLVFHSVSTICGLLKIFILNNDLQGHAGHTYLKKWIWKINLA